MACCSHRVHHKQDSGCNISVACRWDTLSLGYTEAPGLPALRAAISKSYTAIEDDNIVVLAPEEGIFLTLNALLQPDNHVVVTYPGYQTLYEIARSVGCKVDYWQPLLSSNNKWEFDLDELEKLVQSDTKVCCILTRIAEQVQRLSSSPCSI